MTLIKCEAKLNLLDQISVPEDFNLANGHRPDGNFIVSRDRYGNTVSVYGDTQWDISTWHAEGRRTVLNFEFWRANALTPIRQEISRDARWLVFSMIWIGDDNPLSAGSLQGILTVIRALARNAENMSCSLLELLSEENRLIAFLNSKGPGPWANLKTLCSILSRLARIGEAQLGFCIVGEKIRKRLNTQFIQVKAQQKQTPPIPTEIYSSILSSLMRELDEWEKVAPEFLKIIQDCGKDPRYGRRDATQKVLAERLNIRCNKELSQWSDIASPCVRAYLKNKGVCDNVAGIASILVEVQAVAKLTIQALSGMRENEAATLPYACLNTSRAGGRNHRIIQGYSTKFSKGIKIVRWVTNKEGQRAIEIAQEIATAIYAACGTTADVRNKARSTRNIRPLFVSLSYTHACASKPRFKLDDHFFPIDLSLYKFGRLLSRILPVIREKDVLELEEIDEHRAWRSESKFQIGRPWPLATHQLRRSLALYAQRSGLVSLPSLRRQLQHLTEEMSRYYSRGSLYAVDLFGSEPAAFGHFSQEWQLSKVESEAISYARNVLFTDEKLFGGHAAFVSQRLRGTDSVVSPSTKAETLRMFKKGQLHYRETLIGGCTRSDECERPAMDWMNLQCISSNCGNMVGNLMKLESVVKEQMRAIEVLIPTSLLYRTEKANLAILTGALEKAQRWNVESK